MNLYRPVEADPHDWFSAEQLEDSRRYNRTRQTLAFTTGAVGFLTLVVVIGTRLVGRVIAALHITNWVVGAVVAVALVVIAPNLTTFPWTVLERRHELRWGFTDQSTADWLRDELLQLAVAVTTVSAAMIPLLAIIRSTSDWWLLAWAAVCTIVLIVSGLYPTVFLPLFNKQTPIEDPAVRERIKRFSREAGVHINDVFTMDASKQTHKDTAFYDGIGPWKRLVLGDNLLKRSPREIDTVLSQMYAAIRRRQPAKRAFTVFVLALVSFALLGALSRWDTVLRLVGVPSFGDPRALPFILLVFGICSFVTSLALSWLARAFVRQRVLDALDFTRDANTYIDAYRELATRNLGELDPSWWHRIRSENPTPAERLALGTMWRSTRKVTVLFTDIERSTQMVERLGDEGWFELRRDHDEIVRGKVSEHRGTEVDAAGDGFLLVFEDAGEALLCAMEIQRDIDDYNAFHSDANLRVRMGVHTGEVIRREREVYGRDVHLAARVAAQARGGQIVVSGPVCDSLSSAGRFSFGPSTEVELKGLAGRHRVHVVERGLDSRAT